MKMKKKKNERNPESSPWDGEEHVGPAPGEVVQQAGLEHVLVGEVGGAHAGDHRDHVHHLATFYESLASEREVYNV